MIVITGASGRTGGAAARALLEKGEKPRVVGRDAKKLQSLVERGAEAFVGNVEDPTFLTKAFKGASAVYVVLPEDISRPDLRAHQEHVSDSFAAAVSGAHVPYAVALSSIGAQHPEGTGTIVGLHSLEQKLTRVAGLNLLCLRCGYFKENLLLSLARLYSLGMLVGGLRGDFSMPWIATRDIGAYAAKRIIACDFSGSSIQELHGQRDLSMQQAASIIGRAIDKPNLEYKQLPLPVLESELAGMGMPRSNVASIIEMWRAANAGLIAPQERRSVENSTSTTLESFAEEVFAPAYTAFAARQ